MRPLCLIEFFDESQTFSNLFSNQRHPEMSSTPERMSENIVISRTSILHQFDIQSQVTPTIGGHLPYHEG